MSFTPGPTKPFDFTRLLITWGSFSLNIGLESVKFSRAEDAWSIHVSTDGTVTRVKNNNRSGMVELTYGLNSSVHDVLSAQAELDEASGTAIYPLEVKDGNGTTVATAPNAWIKKVPDGDWQKEVQPRMWPFECDALRVFIGGLA